MKNTKSIKEYFARVTAMTNKIKSNGEVTPDSKVVEKILRTLTERFTYVVISIEEVRDTTTMSIDELQSSLAVHEQKFKKMNVEEDHALRVEQTKYGRGGGRMGSRGRGRGRGRSLDKATIECYKCHKLGHFRFECPSWDKANYAEAQKRKKKCC
ncbi:uncharacterized protein LOC124909530 [Impatiens glandulifera]|uniref:uncharacterized protein LOC124909530 n=1 Tax=Impatiens glandulifera TaxID=253017 RepID=UPI001FB17400|nr:uncharacterized protein LOC124909530 [Impatiens glandulifera]